MKTLRLSFVLLCSLMLTISCDKGLEETEKFAPASPTDMDEEAGDWDLIVLANYDVLPAGTVPAPADASSDAYKNELATIKAEQATLTAKQKEIIEYWSAGGVIRWNQFLRELVARYNLPPAPNAQGTYPLPDAENPFADPNFPFANPPYAARAYSYVSVAQYEALKAAWHFKELYPRIKPYEHADGPERIGVSENDLPGYPSEDATLSGVSAEMLKALFPAALKEITLKAAEQRNAARWSGKASTTDISVGLALGKAIAAEVMKRARTDNMGTSAGNKTKWDALVKACEDRGEMPWKSQESPARPPMLMNFGAVKAWNMTADQIVANRPVAPPLTGSDEMANEVKEVKRYFEGMDRKQQAIVHKWADGVGTYTPPGHWNDIATEYIYNANFSEVRTARIYALLNMAMHDAAVGCWETKMFYFNPRPSQMDKSIKTATGLPNFPAYTSGHSTFSAAAATILSHFFPSESAYFEAQAREASLSRLYGGIHYRSDIEMGYDHGVVIAGFTLDYAETDGADGE